MEKSTGLSNEDFIRIVQQTPKQSNSSTDDKNEAPKGDNDDKKKLKPQKKKKKDSGFLALQRRQKELAEKYRDRAAERRKGVNKDFVEAEEIKQALENTDAPLFGEQEDANIDPSELARERRRRLIEESKYLGGDISRTHLVKGLDLALLEKTRAENEKREQEEAEMVKKREEAKGSSKSILKKKTDVIIAGNETVKCKTRLARTICDALFSPPPSTAREFFAPGRMAYVFDLSMDSPFEIQNDVPVTVIRSKAEVVDRAPVSAVTVNDVVLNKLTEILSYIRSGRRGSKKSRKKREKVEKAFVNPVVLPEDVMKAADVDIFEDAGDYTPRDAKTTDLNRKRRVTFNLSENSTHPVTEENGSNLLMAIPAPGPSLPTCDTATTYPDMFDDAADDITSNTYDESISSRFSPSIKDEGDDEIDEFEQLLQRKREHAVALERQRNGYDDKSQQDTHPSNAKEDSQSQNSPLEQASSKRPKLSASSQLLHDSTYGDFSGEEEDDDMFMTAADSDDDGSWSQEVMEKPSKKSKTRTQKANQTEKVQLDRDIRKLDEILKKRGSSGIFNKQKL